MHMCMCIYTYQGLQKKRIPQKSPRILPSRGKYCYLLISFFVVSFSIYFCDVSKMKTTCMQYIHVYKLECRNVENYMYINYYPASLKHLIVYHDYFPTLCLYTVFKKCQKNQTVITSQQHTQSNFCDKNWLTLKNYNKTFSLYKAKNSMHSIRHI